MNPALLFQLLAGHALADFALQSEVMARGKNRNVIIDPARIPPGHVAQTVWPYWLVSHALVHGLVVSVVTGVWWLGLAETVLHFGIDFIKTESWTTVHADQALHVGCKLIWWGML